jgi:hypothetical protein
MVSKNQLRNAAKQNPNIPSGVDLMRKINEGVSQKTPSEYIQTVRTSIVDNCDELLEVGARIRPMLVEGKQIGWVRGIHHTERRRLSRWLFDSNEYLVTVLTLATTLTRPEIEDLSPLEFRNLIMLVQKMSDYDISLFPYISAFTSTFVSENLWHGQGTRLTSFENRVIDLPDGNTMKILVPSDHARLWASLCVYREQAKVRLDASWNAVLQVRPMAGKSVDPLAAELKKTSRQLAANSMEPWESLVKSHEATDLDDGWAHAENLETREGMLKELHGMLANDRHEQLMAKFEKQQIDAAEERRKAIEAMSRRRGGPGINEETIRVETDADVRQREKDLKKGRMAPAPIDRSKTETTPNPVERIKRYQ